MTESSRRVQEALEATSADLLAYFERRVPDREDAADLLGETMLQAWRRADALPSEAEHCRMWLFTIATNVLANHRRALGRRSALIAQVRSVLRAAGDEAEMGERAAVRDAVRRLPPHQRELIMLVHWDRFKVAEAAELLGINASTARSRYSAARTVLQNSLTESARC
jgi:RNA polymerase sigma-70 factor, ECF subfamily